MQNLAMLPQDVMSMHRITGFAHGRKTLSLYQFKTILQNRHKSKPMCQKQLERLIQINQRVYLNSKKLVNYSILGLQSIRNQKKKYIIIQQREIVIAKQLIRAELKQFQKKYFFCLLLFIQNILQELQYLFKMDQQVQALSPSFDTKISQTLESIADQCSDQDFSQLKIKIQTATLLEEIQYALSDVISKKQAKQKGIKIFQELGKDKFKIDKMDLFVSKLRSKIDPQTVTKIQHHIKAGKKKSIQRILIQKLGSIGGTELFNQFEKDIPEVQAMPIQGSVYIRLQKGLKVYQYKENLSQSEKLNAKAMIVFGQTGCGKSTFLNSVANYIAGVQLQDNFRYNIIVEDVKSQTGSITSKITDYYLKDKYTQTVYRLIDTPGFGDTRGISKDEQIIYLVRKKFQQDLDSIHNILFVMKSSSTRITEFQKYIFQNVMDLFNKDIAPNFVFIFTFSDSGQAQVLQSVKCPKFGFGSYWNQISQPKYLPVNNCGIFQRWTPTDKMTGDYWKIGIKCIKQLFEKVNKIQPKSLTKSKELMFKKQTLANKIRYTHQTIQRATSKRQNIKAKIEKIVQYSQLIDQNKTYTYEVPQQVWYQEYLGSNVTRCVNCANSNCHVGCGYGNNEDKRNCCAFSNQYCTICPKKCHWRAHKNEVYIMKVKQVMETITNEDNKRKFQLNNQNLNSSETMLQKMMIELEKEMNVIIDCAEEMSKLQKELVETQMSNCKPESTISYLQYLVVNEKKAKSPGWTTRVQSYNDAIKQMQMLQRYSKGDIDTKSVIKNLNKNNFHTIIENVKNPSLFQRFKNFFT